MAQAIATLSEVGVQDILRLENTHRFASLIASIPRII
jgi:hypothetical protein